MAISGLIFTVGTGVLFLWGIWLGLMGLATDHVAFRDGGHAPGATGTFDPVYMEKIGKRVA